MENVFLISMTSNYNKKNSHTLCLWTCFLRHIFAWDYRVGQSLLFCALLFICLW
jgi:hypothetical protein